MLILIKGGNKKFLDDESTLIPLLKKEGWVVEGEETIDEPTDDIEALKAEATALGIEYHHKAGVKKLKELIEAAK